MRRWRSGAKAFFMAKRQMMRQYLRYFFLLVLMLWNVQAFAADEIDRFAKKCDLFDMPTHGFNAKASLKKEANALNQAKVPIRMSFSDCASIKYIIKLENGTNVSLESAFPTKENPDNKGESYTWNSNSPSENYWRFDKHGWECNGFLLVNKTTGREITETTECRANVMRMQNDLLALVCEGAYENSFPSLYIVDIGKKKTLWSEALRLKECQEYDVFASSRFEFTSINILNVAGECQQRDYEFSEAKKDYFFKVGRRSKVKDFSVKITSEGLVTRFAGKETTVNWKSETLN
jgi:hypothetical protein